MIFETCGQKGKPVILFFHAMGVVGSSSTRIAENLKEDYFSIMPTSTVYCHNQKYISKEEEIRQVENYLDKEGVTDIALVCASSLGADIAMSFLSSTKRKIGHVFIDGGQYAQINKFTRRIMTPFLYFAIRSLYKKNGENLGKILWCDDKKLRPYFVQAGKELKYNNLRRQLSDSLVNKPFPILTPELQKHCFIEFGSIEEHFKYRDAVMKAYPYAHFPIFENYNHMQYQIQDQKGFAEMIDYIIKNDSMPDLPFLK